MRALVLYELLSLDGVAEEPSDWLFDDGPEIFDNLGIVISSQDDILLGRGTYDYWADFWPTATVEPFASFINNTMKHVFSSAPIDAEWSNTTVVSEPAVDYVAALKQGEGGDIGIHGSIGLAGSLLEAKLVDELRLVVAPTIAGRGKRLFRDLGAQKLRLVEEHRTEGGALLLHYRVRSRRRIGHRDAELQLRQATRWR